MRLVTYLALIIFTVVGLVHAEAPEPLDDMSYDMAWSVQKVLTEQEGAYAFYGTLMACGKRKESQILQGADLARQMDTILPKVMTQFEKKSQGKFKGFPLKTLRAAAYGAIYNKALSHAYGVEHALEIFVEDKQKTKLCAKANKQLQVILSKDKEFSSFMEQGMK